MKKQVIDAVIFDLDGVVTRTAKCTESVKQTFDRVSALRETRDHEPFREFTHENDYLPFVDGKPRIKAYRVFLSRGYSYPVRRTG